MAARRFILTREAAFSHAVRHLTRQAAFSRVGAQQRQPACLATRFWRVSATISRQDGNAFDICTALANDEHFEEATGEERGPPGSGSAWRRMLRRSGRRSAR